MEAERDGLALQALVDPARHHCIKRAVFKGAATPLQRGLLEALCRGMEGRPIQNAGDHAGIELEFSLRDRAGPRHVAGVQQPENADPAFALPTALARGLLADYRRKTGYAETANFFDPPVSASWKALPNEVRMEQLRSALLRHPDGSKLELVRVEGVKRVVVRFAEELSSLEKQACLMRVEADLKARIERELYLYVEPRKDANVLRKEKV